VPGARASRLARILDALEARYGEPTALPRRNAFEWILWENVAYLVSDEKRASAFRALTKTVGTSPEKILSAAPEALLEVASLGGMRHQDRAARLRSIAEIALRDFHGDLSSVLALPLPKAKKALKKFPSIGDPGAEKILLFTRATPLLALDSNGLRVLTRLGFGEEKKSYDATYRSAQAAAEPQLRTGCPERIRAHQLLRRHGQELCKRNEPLCPVCPVSRVCAFFQRRG